MKPSLNAKKQMKKRLARAPTVHGVDVLKDNYDPKLTLRQNYAKLGLIPSLDVRPDTGGVEKPFLPSTSASTASASTGASSKDSAAVRKGMARVVRDDHGNIIDIIEAPDSDDEQENGQAATPWGKPLKSSIADRDDIETFMPPPQHQLHQHQRGVKPNQVIAQLEDLASQAAPVERHSSQLESQWLADLVAKYGDDTEAMVKDRRLNVWQKTQGEIKRAIKKAGGFAAFQ